MVTPAVGCWLANVTKERRNMDVITECEMLVETIGVRLQEKRRRLGEIGVQIAELEEQGVYDSIPSESFEARNGGEKRYLRLVFPTGGRGRRKVYIGADSAAIEAAREKVKRTKLLLAIQAEQRRIDARVVRSRASLREVEQRLGGGSLW